MKSKIAIVLFFIGIIIIAGSMWNRKISIKASTVPIARVYSRERLPSRTGIERRETPIIREMRAPERISLFKEVMEYIKEILGSLSSIAGFILYLLERRKRKNKTLSFGSNINA